MSAPSTNVSPVIVGVGHVANKDPERIVHPIELMAEAARLAEEDAGAGVLAHVDAVHAAPMSVFGDDDASDMICARLDLDASERVQWAYSGSAAQSHLGDVCRQVTAGEIDAALLVGGIADDSVRNAGRAGIEPPAPPTGVWSVGAREKGLKPAPKARSSRPSHFAEGAAGAAMPTAFFALVESVMAASAGRTPDEHRVALGRLLAPFSEVAVEHGDLAWNPGPYSAGEIATATPANRLVAEPYTKLMCSYPTVDLAGAVLVVSDVLADRLGVSADRRVHPWAVADASESGAASGRARMDRSVALDSAVEHVRGVMAGAGVEIGAFDLYSCFPAAIEMAVDAFGVDADDPRPFTLTGGLPYFGGPGASYVLHSIVAAVERARSESASPTAVVGLGGIIANFSVGVYAGEPGPAFSRWSGPSVEGAVDLAPVASGEAVVEAATVLHDREAGPVAAPVIARLPDGRRVGARAADPELPAELAGGSLVGQTIDLAADGEQTAYRPR